jgi:hypothetical protein
VVRHSGARASANLEPPAITSGIPGSRLRRAPEGGRGYALARSLRMLKSSTGRSGMTIRKVAPMVPSTR